MGTESKMTRIEYCKLIKPKQRWILCYSHAGGARQSNCRQHPPRLFTNYFSCTILKKKSILRCTKNFLRGLKNGEKLRNLVWFTDLLSILLLLKFHIAPENCQTEPTLRQCSNNNTTPRKISSENSTCMPGV
jgi:hypothetical protein